jgi:hypothetical protein
MVKVIEGTLEQAGGYSVDGQEFISEGAEQLVDEARMMACMTGRSIEEALSLIIPPTI